MAGYSDTPLVRKLGLKPGMRAAVIAPPQPYHQRLGSPESPPLLLADAPLPTPLDFLHIFTATRTDLECMLASARRALAPAGFVWVSWPKKSSRLPSEVTEDTIRDVALPLGLVDVKVCAVDEVWSGLKLCIRRDQRQAGS